MLPERRRQNHRILAYGAVGIVPTSRHAPHYVIRDQTPGRQVTLSTCRSSNGIPRSPLLLAQGDWDFQS